MDSPKSQNRWRQSQVRQLTSNLAQYHTPLTSDVAYLGFRGWHSRGFLPHFDQPDTTQAITFRLADSLPEPVVARLASMPESSEKRVFRERWLDRCRGASWLGRPDIASLVEEALLKFDGDRYRLCAWCVMPNHVHVLVGITGISMGRIVKDWKGYTAWAANRLLGRKGTFWEADYWDRYMRNERHFLETVRYIEANPIKAHLTETPDPRAWRWSSAWRRDGFLRLPPIGGANC